MSQVESSSTTRQPYSSRQRTWLALWSLIRLIIILPLWLFGLVALLLGVALSPWGTGFLFSQGQERGFFTFEHQEGALLDEFTLQGFRLELGNIRVVIDDFELAWADDCLLSRRLCIDTLRVDGADIRIGASETEAPPNEDSAPFRLYLPFPVELRSVALDNVAVQLADGTRIDWDNFETSATAEQSRVAFAPSQLDQLTVYLPPSPGVQLTENTQTPLTPEAIDGAVLAAEPRDEAMQAVSLEESLAARDPVELPEIVLPVDFDISDLTVTDIRLTGAFEYAIERLQLGLETEESRVEVTSLEVLSDDAQANLTANVDLTGNYPLDAQLNAVLFLPERFPELDGEVLELTLSGPLDNLQAELTASGIVTATLDAEVNALAPELPFEARLQSERLQWPLVNAAVEGEDQPPPYVIEAVDAVVSGSLTAYQADIQLAAQGPELPLTQVSLSGQGDFSHFQWQPLALQVEESTLRSEGRIDWLAPLTIDTRIRLEQFDPSHFVDQMDGSLTGDIELGVRQQGDIWSVSIANIDIGGQLRDYPLTLQAALDANSNMEVDIHELLFTQGNNRLEASGQVSEQSMSLNADIALRELRTLSPELAGTLSGEVRATGSFAQPEIVADLAGRDLRFADNSVERLELDATVQGLDDPRLDVQLGLQQIFAGGQRLTAAELNLTGRLSQHQLEVDVQGDPDTPLQQASLGLDGRFDQARQQYQGRLTPLEIDSEAGTIRLEAPLELSYNLANGQARLSPFCLRREEGGLVCSQEPINASADQGRAVLTVREVPMEMLEPFLPDEWSFEGATTADATLAWRQGGARWQADVQVLSELAITAINDYGQPVRLPAINLDAQLQANQSQADTNMVLSFSEAGDLTLNLSLSDPMGQGRLEGELLANNLSLEPYRPMVVNMDRLEGAIDGRVQIGGTTGQPDLQGSLALRGLRLHGPDIPLDVRDGELTISFDGEQGDINGFLAAERGRLNITGDTYWPGADDWRIGVDLNATQDPLLLVLPQFGRLEAAPDIRVRVTPERLQVRGNVDLPWARLEIGSRSSSAIEPSSDEIIITESDDRAAEEAAREAERRALANGDDPSAAEELAQTGMELDVLITLTLGRDMQISAYGLESGLGGTLEIRQDSGGLQLFGDVNLVDGRFQAFGQDLLIRRGQLLFSGPPSLPTLDFEAIRNPEVTEDDVIAGLRVTGSAEEPNVMIFSEPSMGETQALSYLLRGRAPDAGGGMDSALTTALIGMSLGRTGGAVGSIGEAFGIDDLALDTTGAGDESQVALSGQLTDDIRISYGVGIFSPIAELTLRYTLWRNLYVQAVSGANQAVDLIYTFSRRGDPVIYKQQ
ncbi:autotransporter secretion inner membrane protein TamB [Vreelandella songnenensis]|uniref:Autotransporter secretion inner membrane protein TamB n=1 Tax=Vreelandella songnenensis TaxID=1176243 RepID=A0A2T0V619_9GAMM|nr:translocation/assembly module TamB domain-containing protein [Halomonas songnenensis]PRY65620.1 autotransporter secretion inner membrane protein TamB [Halomonas songnenensis]